MQLYNWPAQNYDFLDTTTVDNLRHFPLLYCKHDFYFIINLCDDYIYMSKDGVHIEKKNFKNLTYTRKYNPKGETKNITRPQLRQQRFITT